MERILDAVEVIFGLMLSGGLFLLIIALGSQLHA